MRPACSGRWRHLRPRGYPETDKAFTYLLLYSAMYGLADVLTVALNNVGFDGLSGTEYLKAMQADGDGQRGRRL